MSGNGEKACAGHKPYHHGNLRDALILAAADLIRERASIDFAMVDAARRAGVSSAAPYRHFKDRDALLEAVCHVAFMALTESTRQTAASVDTGTEEGIIAIGKGYLDFVTGHPEFYDLMWGDMGLRALESVDEGIKSSGFYVLVDAVSSWCAGNGVSNYDALALAVKLWAMAHGLACLTMNQSLENFLPGVDSHALLDSTTRTFLEGLRRETRA
jgi:AcrR family transcriptional regulator